MSGSSEVALFRLTMGLLVVHLLADALIALEPGVSAGDHWLAATVPAILVIAAGTAYGRMRAGARALLALGFGAFALVAAAVAAAHAGTEALDIADVTGLLLAPAGIALLALGAAVAWRSRKPAGRVVLRRALLALATLAFAFEVLLPIGFAWVATHRPADAPAAADLGRPYRAVGVTLSDGLELSGWYVPSQNGAAVITFPDREGTADHARMLAEAGYGVLALDMRGYGDSQGDPNAYGWGAVADLEGGVDFLRDQADVDPGRIGALGLSVGGEQVLEAAAADDDLAAVVSEGAGERSVRETLLFGPAAALAIPQQAVLTAAVAVFSGDGVPPALDDVAAEIAPRAVFLIRGENGQAGEELNDDYFEAAGEPKELWEVPGAGHTGGIDAEPEEYERRVVGFFDRAFGPS
jgi:dienelactone hydrolase